MRTRVLVCALTALVLLSGCTAEKARALRNAAIQFKAESHAAIQLMDATVEMEHAPAPRTGAQADADFAEAIIALMQANDEITTEDVEFARDPFAVQDDPETAAAQQQFVNTLTEQYTAFADAFEDLEQGFLFSAGAVYDAGPTAKRLTAQLVVFARTWSDNPPRFIQRRSALLIRMEDAATDESLSAEQRNRALYELNEAWGNLREEEARAQRAVIEQCLKAATLGREVQTMIHRFDKASLEDIQNFVALAFQQTSLLTGADTADLAARANALFTELRTDPFWSETIDLALQAAQPDTDTAP